MVDKLLKKALKVAAGKGKGKDTILAHVNPREVELLKKHGGEGTRNEHTGLMQFDTGEGGDAAGGADSGEGDSGSGGSSGSGPGMGASGEPGGGPSGTGSGGGADTSTGNGPDTSTDTGGQGKSATAMDASHGFTGIDSTDYTGASPDKGFMAQIAEMLGISPSTLSMAGKALSFAGKAGLPVAGPLGMAIGVGNTISSMAEHGLPDVSNVGQSGNVAGGADKGGVGTASGGAGDSFGGTNLQFGTPPPLQTAQDRMGGVGNLGPQSFGGQGFSFGPPPPTQTAMQRGMPPQMPPPMPPPQMPPQPQPGLSMPAPQFH